MFGTQTMQRMVDFAAKIWPPQEYTRWVVHLEFGQPDWDYTKLFILFGLQRTTIVILSKWVLEKLKKRRKIVGVNPIRTGYNAVADEC